MMLKSTSANNCMAHGIKGFAPPAAPMPLDSVPLCQLGVDLQHCTAVVTDLVDSTARAAQDAIDQATQLWLQGATAEAQVATDQAERLLDYAARSCKALERLLIRHSLRQSGLCYAHPEAAGTTPEALAGKNGSVPTPTAHQPQAIAAARGPGMHQLLLQRQQQQRRVQLQVFVGIKRPAAAMLDDTEGEPEVTSRWRPYKV